MSVPVERSGLETIMWTSIAVGPVILAWVRQNLQSKLRQNEVLELLILLKQSLSFVYIHGKRHIHHEPIVKPSNSLFSQVQRCTAFAWPVEIVILVRVPGRYKTNGRSYQCNDFTQTSQPGVLKRLNSWNVTEVTRVFENHERPQNSNELRLPDS